VNEPRPLPRRRQRNETGRSGEARFTPISLILIGLLIGVAGSLYYTWIVDPVIYVDASPARLRADFKAEYIFLVGQSFVADEDWPRAQRRLDLLADPGIGQTITTLLEQTLRRGDSAERARSLALLAAQLGETGPAVAIFAPTVAVVPDGSPTPTAAAATATPTLTATSTLPPTATPTATTTPTATATPSPTPRPAYRLLSQERVCQRTLPAPRIEVITVNAFLEQEPGVTVVVSWEDGEDRFYTGFQPEFGAGYGDFLMAPDVSYSVGLVPGSPVVSGLRIEPCPANLGGLPGGWRLTFQNLTIPTREP
jgi:hypothetical protein